MLLLRAENLSFGVNASNAALALGAALGLGVGPQARSQLPCQVPPTGVSIRSPQDHVSNSTSVSPIRLIGYSL